MQVKGWSVSQRLFVLWVFYFPLLAVGEVQIEFATSNFNNDIIQIDKSHSETPWVREQFESFWLSGGRGQVLTRNGKVEAFALYKINENEITLERLISIPDTDNSFQTQNEGMLLDWIIEKMVSNSHFTKIKVNLPQNLPERRRAVYDSRGFKALKFDRTFSRVKLEYSAPLSASKERVESAPQNNSDVVELSHTERLAKRYSLLSKEHPGVGLLASPGRPGHLSRFKVGGAISSFLFGSALLGVEPFLSLYSSLPKDAHPAYHAFLLGTIAWSLVYGAVSAQELPSVLQKVVLGTRLAVHENASAGAARKFILGCRAAFKNAVGDL